MKISIAIFGSALALTAVAGAAVVTEPNARPAQLPSEVRVANFAVANMTCWTCPITVKRAMSEVHGVRSVKIDFKAKRATVQFDPKLTNAAAIAGASTDAGYPAKVTG